VCTPVKQYVQKQRQMINARTVRMQPDLSLYGDLRPSEEDCSTVAQRVCGDILLVQRLSTLLQPGIPFPCCECQCVMHSRSDSRPAR